METTTIGTGLNALTIPRVIIGLGRPSAPDIGNAFESVGTYLSQGLNAFDTADICGPAADVVGGFRRAGGQCVALVQWSPSPSPSQSGSAFCADAMSQAAMRLAGPVDLLQYHISSYERPTYIENLHHLAALQASGAVRNVGLCNVDLAHLRILVGSGYALASNQVHVSVLDRRVQTGGMAAYCAQNNIALLAHGTLLGGFITDEWVNKPEPTSTELAHSPSLQKYKTLIDATGGWGLFQQVLTLLGEIATKHSSNISAVAVRYVLDIPGISAVILGTTLNPAALGSTGPIAQLRLDEADHARLRTAQDSLAPVRHEELLLPAPDPAQAAQMAARTAQVDAAIARGARVEYLSGSAWEPVCGMCRSVRVGNRILVSGTTTRPHPSGERVIGSTCADQAVFIFDLIRGAVLNLGGSMGQVLRTRMLFADVQRDWQAVGAVQAAEFSRFGIMPANTMVGGLSYVINPGALIEIEAEVEVVPEQQEVVRLLPLAD